jgi:hypothetical protein
MKKIIYLIVNNGAYGLELNEAYEDKETAEKKAEAYNDKSIGREFEVEEIELFLN